MRRFLAGFFLGYVIALYSAEIVNIWIIKTFPPKPREMENDPYAQPWGETWRPPQWDNSTW